MTRKRVVLCTAIFFLIFSSACAHSGGKPHPSLHEPITSAKAMQRSMNDPYRDVPWWDNPEYAWIFPALIVLGIGIAVGGSIYIASGGSGLTVAVSK